MITKLTRVKPHLLKPFYMVLLSGFLLLVFVPFQSPSSSTNNKHFTIRASRYTFNPGIIHVDTGDTVTIELVSTDVVHGLYLDGYDIEIKSDPGQPETITFIANQPGNFRFRCSITCGPIHPFMIGKLKVGTNTLLLRSIGLASLLAIVVAGRKR